jgi:BlaI family transcriptional regulator, penicillinase repressor
MTKEAFIKPTESELEILHLLWEKKAASVREIHDTLAKTKDVGYTTTLKLMQIMHIKGLVTRDKTTRTHVYKATLEQEVAQKHILNKMINTLFSGSSTDLVLQVLGNHKTSREELKKIEAYLQNMNL